MQGTADTRRRTHSSAAAPAAYMAAAAGVAAGLVLMRYGVDFGDEPYQIMLGTDARTAPMSLLSAWAGAALGALFCPEGTLLQYRLLAWALTILATGVSAAVCFRLTGRRQAVAAGAAAAALWLGAVAGTGTWQYGWDCYSSLMLALFASAYAWYLRGGGRAAAAAAGVATALAALSRLPDVLLLPCGVALVALGAPAGRRTARAMLFAAAAAAVFTAVTTAAYGSPAAYADALRANTVADHSARTLAASLLKGMAKAAPGAILVAASFAASGRLRRRPKAAAALAAACALALTAAAWRCRLRPDMAAATLTSGLLLAALLRLHATRTQRLLALAACVCATVAAAGSNTGFIKVPAAVLLPLAAGLLWPGSARAQKLFAAMLIAGTAACGLLWRAHHSLIDTGFMNSCATVAAGPMKGLHTSESVAAAADSCERVIDTLRSRGYSMRVLGTTTNRFVWELSAGARLEPLRHAWDEDGSSMASDVYRRHVAVLADTLTARARVAVLAPTLRKTAAGVACDPVDPTLDSLLRRRLVRLPVSAPGMAVYGVPDGRF